MAVLVGHGEDEVDFVDADTKDLASVFGRLLIGAVAAPRRAAAALRAPGVPDCG